ncbi:MAG: hypothetical protein ACREDR_10680 [Blastocatellia bacterium]
MRLLWGSLFTLAAGAILTIAVRTLAVRFGIVAPPRRDRWHSKPTALLGGIAIYTAFLLGFFLFVPHHALFYPVVAAATLLFLTGLIDDLVQIKPYAKLIVQLVAAALVVYYGISLTWTRYDALNDFITIFWLVGITNALNLLDNMDGLSAGIAVVSCAFLGITFMINGQPAAACFSFVLGGSAAGFLVFNFNPASIFMGDAGSMFLGFALGSIALISDYGRSRNLAAILFTPVLILAIPIFDTCVVTVTRKVSGRPISQGGRDHTSHRLVALGMSERRAVLWLYSFAAISGALALLVRLLEVEVALLLVPAFALAVIFVGLYLGKVRIGDAVDRRKDGTIISFLTDFSYKRRVFEVMLDLALVVLCYYGSYLVRWDGSLPASQLAIFVRTLPLIIVVQMSFLLMGGVYKGLWKYIGPDDLLIVARAVLFGSLVSSGVVFLMYSFHGPSRGVFLIDTLLLTLFLGGSRISFRLMKALLIGSFNAHPDAKPVFIYGANDDGDLLYRVIKNDPGHGYAAVAFLDDDARKSGKLIHGCRIFESRDLPELIREHGVNEVLVSSLSLSETKLNLLRGMGASLKMMNIRIE